MKKTLGTIKSIQSVSDYRVDFVLTTTNGDVMLTINTSTEPALNAIKKDDDVAITYNPEKNSDGRHEVNEIEAVWSWIG